jgi:dihydrolipoamide dehydrogenase
VLTLSDETELTVDKALLSVGRTPQNNIQCLPNNPATERGAILIDNFMRTDVPNLYAIGDVTGKLPLAHTASKQGLIAAEHILSQVKNTVMPEHELIYENIPRCTFTNPEVSSCGLTEKQALDKYKEIKVGKFQFIANGKALAGGNTNGFVKIIAKADDLQLVGMHIIGPSACELIAQGSILINLKAKASDVDKVVFAHPTLSEAIMEAVEDLMGLSIHKI